MRAQDAERCAVLVFARAPQPGRSKTRLAPALGARGAARVYRALIERTLAAARDAALGPVELWCTPNARHPFLAACRARFGVRLRAQQGEDLGRRMQRALRAALERAHCAVLVGSDIPALDARYLGEAARALCKGDDVVIGPATDGGYVLIGVRRVEARLFRGLRWGGGSVLAQTRRRISALGLRATALAPRSDLDRPRDWARLPPALKPSPRWSERSSAAR